jgi:hypothetical protein
VQSSVISKDPRCKEVTQIQESTLFTVFRQPDRIDQTLQKLNSGVFDVAEGRAG